MIPLVPSLRRHRRLLKDLVARDLKARYLGSSMGFFWSVVFPLINLFVYMFVFRAVLKVRWSDQQGSAEVGLLMLAGIMIWQAFAESVSRMTNTLVENANLIQKVVFPAEVLPIYLTISSLINMLIGLVVAVCGVVFFTYIRPEKSGAVPAPVLWLSPTARDAGAAAVEGRDFINVGAFRCASNPAGTEFAADSVEDKSPLTWNQAVEPWKPASVDFAAKNDRVYAANGVWAVVKFRSGNKLALDHWRDARGEPASTPPNGTQAFVVVPPERPLGLGLSLVCLPLLIALQSLLMLGFGYFLAAFNLILRDTYHLIGVLLTVWMFATPIFYPSFQVENAGFGWILRVNPMHWLIDGYREILIYGAWPNWGMLAAFLAVSVTLLWAGAAFFMTKKPSFPDLL